MPQLRPVEERPGFWSTPAQFLLDAGKEGEMLIARVRLALTAVLLIIPIANLIGAAPEERAQHEVGFAITFGGFLLAAVIYFLVSRDRRYPWLPLATSFLDISLITLAQVIYSFVMDAQTVLNSRITFDTYFIALAATCLRYDKRVALLAGLMCIAQFVGTVAFVLMRFDIDTSSGIALYGRFQWSDQISRVVLLFTATVLNVYIVSGIQRQRTLSNADPLTGAHNRRFFDEYLQTELIRSARTKSVMAIAMIDVDHFKEFNDRYGHSGGDVALRQVARTLSLAVRRSDLVARYGGEEFVVIMRESTAAQAMDRMEHIRRSVAEAALVLDKLDPPQTVARVTVSIGVATCPTDGRTAPDLINEADRRLYEAKNAGRNRVVGPSLI